MTRTAVTGINPTAIRDTFAAHRSEIIGAARRAPRDHSIWAVVEEDGTWYGICGPFQRGNYPSILHDKNSYGDYVNTHLYSLRFSANPFMSRDSFDDTLLMQYEQWIIAEDEARKMEQYERDLAAQYS